MASNVIIFCGKTLIPPWNKNKCEEFKLSPYVDGSGTAVPIPSGVRFNARELEHEQWINLSLVNKHNFTKHTVEFRK